MFDPLAYKITDKEADGKLQLIYTYSYIESSTADLYICVRIYTYTSTPDLYTS